MVYTERDLIIPALQVMKEKGNGIGTSELIRRLTAIMNPTGRNGEILAGRKDTYFSQKVRNLKSHDTLTNIGVATYEDGIWKITEKGLGYLGETIPIVESLEEQGIDKKKISDIHKDFSEIIIEEGAMDRRTVKQRARSNKLRNIAVKQFKEKHNGELFCIACEFNFAEEYGEWGEDFIEIHHKEGIHTKDIEGSKTTLDKALKNVVPLCSNCHRMVHRKKGKMLSIEDLQSLLAGEKIDKINTNP